MTFPHCVSCIWNISRKFVAQRDLCRYVTFTLFKQTQDYFVRHSNEASKIYSLMEVFECMIGVICYF